MTSWLITMGGAKYDDTTAMVLRDAPNMGADRVLVYDDVWVEAHPFRKLNSWLWDHPGDPRGGKRGFGWYAWKPLLILHTLDVYASMSDVVLYLDADSRPVSDFSVIYETAGRDGAMFFQAQGHSNHRWNKTDCLIAMGLDWETHRYKYVPAGCARFCAFRSGDWKARQFLYEWLTYNVNPTATTFDYSQHKRVTPPIDRQETPRAITDPLGLEHPEFEEHRTEQAIMTNLAHKYGYKLHRECDDSGEESNEDRDLYGQLFVQNRQGECANGRGSKYRNVDLPDERSGY